MEFDPDGFEEEDVIQQRIHLEQTTRRICILRGSAKNDLPLSSDTGQEDSGNTLHLNVWKNIIAHVQEACIEPLSNMNGSICNLLIGGVAFLSKFQWTQLNYTNCGQRSSCPG